MFQRCMLVLYETRATLHDWFSLMYPPEHLENEAKLRILVEAILVDEAVCSTLAKSGSSESRACGPFEGSCCGYAGSR